MYYTHTITQIQNKKIEYTISILASFFLNAFFFLLDFSAKTPATAHSWEIKQ